MPRADFYEGLPLAEQLEKFLDHHHDPVVRHISSDEADILRRAVSRLKAGVRAAQREAEVDEVWRRLDRFYETTVVRPHSSWRLHLVSFPAASLAGTTPEDVFGDAVVAAAKATPRTAQIALNVLMRGSLEPDTPLDRIWAEQLARRSPPADASLSVEVAELINQALYQPSIAIEQSPPSFASIAGAIDAEEVEPWVTLIRDQADPLVVLFAAGSIVVFGAARGISTGLREGLKEMFYELTRPERESDDDDD